MEFDILSKRINGLLVFDHLDHVCLKAKTELMGDDFEIHRAAAIKGVNSFLFDESEKRDFFIEDEKLEGNFVDEQTFAGPFYDIKSKKIKDPINSWGPTTSLGIAAAALYPNCEFRLPSFLEKKRDEFFTEMLSNILLYDYFIVEWSTNWSNYFHDGNLYWRSYFWTILFPLNQELLVIGSSVSD